MKVLISLVFLLALNHSYSKDDSCGCKKLKRVFGSTRIQGQCYNTDFYTLAQQPLPSQNMVLIKGGTYLIGTDHPIINADGEAPLRPVELDDFYLDKYEVSIGEFANFVRKSGHVTDAERFGDSFLLYSMVENPTKKLGNAAVAVPWWLLIKGVSWDHPEGPNSTITSW